MTNQIKTPTYVTVANEIAAELRAAGVELVPQAVTIDGHGGNKNWVCFQSAATQHKVYVPRSATKMGVIHTTLSLSHETPGYVDPAGKAPGKIEAFFQPDLDLIKRHLIPLFAGSKDSLRADRRRASSPASQDVTRNIRVGTADDLTAGLETE